MRENEIIKSFGETFVATIFDNMGYEVDIVDAEGIDMVCYRKGERDRGYGVSVKTRNTQNHKNKSINIKYNDIIKTYEQAKEIRGLEPAYALVVMNRENENDVAKNIDILIVTQEYAFKNCFNIFDIQEYDGKTKTFNISKTAKKKWKSLTGEDGVIFTTSYTNE